jgi:hypothetical protein
MFIEDKAIGETAPSLQDFLGFAARKHPEETYNYSDSCGGCAMGQFMAERGIVWSLGAYAVMQRTMFGEGQIQRNEALLSGLPRTWGALHERVKELV